MLLVLIAQAAPVLPADALAGGSGWAGAGLLGAVLAWLLFVHLPNKDKQLGALLADQRAERADADERHDAELGEKRREFETVLSGQAKMFSDQLGIITGQFTAGMREIAESLHELRVEVSEMRRQLPGGR